MYVHLKRDGEDQLYPHVGISVRRLSSDQPTTDYTYVNVYPVGNDSKRIKVAHQARNLFDRPGQVITDTISGLEILEKLLLTPTEIRHIYYGKADDWMDGRLRQDLEDLGLDYDTFVPKPEDYWIYAKKILERRTVR